MGTVHATLRRGLLVLLNGHFQSLQMINNFKHALQACTRLSDALAPRAG
jgi:hypothetical protein